MDTYWFRRLCRLYIVLLIPCSTSSPSIFKKACRVRVQVVQVTNVLWIHYTGCCIFSAQGMICASSVE